MAIASVSYFKTANPLIALINEELHLLAMSWFLFLSGLWSFNHKKHLTFFFFISRAYQIQSLLLLLKDFCVYVLSPKYIFFTGFRVMQNMTS